MAMRTSGDTEADDHGNFKVSVLSELPGYPTGEFYYYPGATRLGGRDGLIVEVNPSTASPWVGVFAFGDVSAGTPNGVFVIPDSTKLCVVVRGQGYVVDVEEPTSWEEIPAIPILQVVQVPSKGLVVFATFTDLIAYCGAGIKWETARLASGGVEITEVTGNVIRGSAWDASVERSVGFTVDLDTGTHEGGARIPT